MLSEAVEEVVRVRRDLVVKAGLETALRALRANIWRVIEGEDEERRERRVGLLHRLRAMRKDWEIYWLVIVRYVSYGRWRNGLEYVIRTRP